MLSEQLVRDTADLVNYEAFQRGVSEKVSAETVGQILRCAVNSLNFYLRDGYRVCFANVGEFALGSDGVLTDRSKKPTLKVNYSANKDILANLATAPINVKFLDTPPATIAELYDSTRQVADLKIVEQGSFIVKGQGLSIVSEYAMTEKEYVTSLKRGDDRAAARLSEAMKTARNDDAFAACALYDEATKTYETDEGKWIKLKSPYYPNTPQTVGMTLPYDVKSAKSNVEAGKKYMLVIRTHFNGNGNVKSVQEVVSSEPFEVIARA